MTVCNPMDTVKDVLVSGNLERKASRGLHEKSSQSQIRKL